MIILNIPVVLQTSPFIFLMSIHGSDKKEIYNGLTETRYSVDTKLLQLMKLCRDPINIEELVKIFEFEYIQELISSSILIDSELVWEITNIKYLEIEISTYCNWRCEYCPVRIDPKSKQIMNMSLFNEIIDKACRHFSIKCVTFNSYNEPTLDPYFEERVRKLSQTHLKLILHTNGSMLDDNKIKLLKETDVVSVIYFNLPSLNSNDFKNITGSSTYLKTMDNIYNAISSGLNVDFSVQALGAEGERSLFDIKEKFEPLIKKEIKAWPTVDRAGVLKNKYAQNINITGYLFGCFAVLEWMYIGVDGNCFICCEDYYQREVYGNIMQAEISEILRSKAAQKMRKYVFGAELAEDNFICRKCYKMEEAKLISRINKKIRSSFL